MAIQTKLFLLFFSSTVKYFIIAGGLFVVSSSSAFSAKFHTIIPPSKNLSTEPAKLDNKVSTAIPSQFETIATQVFR